MSSVTASTIDAKLLAAETDHVIQSVEPVLKYCLHLGAGGSEAEQLLLQTVIPVVSLQFFAQSEHSQIREVPPEQVPDVLQAFAELAVHSKRLDAHPHLKADFWEKVCRSQMIIRSGFGINIPMLQKPKSPAFEVHVGSEHRPVGGISATIAQTLYELLTTRHGGTHTSQLPGNDRRGASQVDPIRIGLSFAHCNLDLDSLVRIQSLLDRVSQHPDRQFSVHMLDLSGNAMGTRELAVVGDIVRKINSGVYQIPILRLDKVIPSSVSSVEGGGGGGSWTPPAETPGPFLEIVRMVLHADRFDISGNRVLQSNVQASQLNQPSSLISVSFSGNHLCPQVFCSSRLGATLRESSGRAALELRSERG